VIITLVEGLVNIKKYKKIDAHTVALISNSSELYPPIYLTAKDNPQIVGKVIKVLAAADII
jgi:SOS-response transcriptional repressor LexA